MKLYDIAQELRNALDNLEVDEDGCIVNAEQLEQLSEDFDAKAEAIACYIKEEEAEAMAIGLEIKNLQDRKAAHEKSADNLRDYLKDMMLYTGKSKFESAKCKLSFRKSEKVLIEDGAVLPEQFVKVETIMTAKKAELKAALKSGEVIDGVSLEVNQNLQVK